MGQAWLGKELVLGFPHNFKRVAGCSIGAGVSLVIMLSMIGGCETQSFFDPSEMGQYSRKPLAVPILRNLDTGIEEPD
jgi:hypothetical protein